MTSTYVTEAIANHVPILMLTYDPAVIGITPVDVAAKLRAQTPSIEVASARGNTLGISTWMLLPTEELVVARELRKLLKSGKPTAKAAKA